MFTAHLRPQTGAELDWSAPATWIDLVDGRSAVLFALCAGVSLALWTDRMRPALVAPRVLLRSVALFVIGSLLMALGTPVLVILPMYAVVFVATVPLLRARPSRVTVVAAASVLLGPPIAMLGALVVPWGVDPLVSGVLIGAYPAVTWWSIVLVGLLLVRLDLGRLRTQLVALGAGTVAAVVGYGGGVLLSAVVPPTAETFEIPASSAGSLLDGLPVEASGGGSGGAAGLVGASADWHGLVSVEPHAGSTFEVLGATGVAVAVLAVLLLIARVVPTVLAPVAAVGRIALTLYVAHIVAVAVLERCGVLLGDDQGPLGGWLPLLVTATVGLAVAIAWRGQGPVERLVAAVSRRFDRVTGAASGAR